MINAIRSEWIKLRSARSNVVLICLAIGLPLVPATLIAIFANLGAADEGAFQAMVIAPAYMCVFFAGVVGVLGIGQEYRHSTIRTTFAAEPRRSRVLTAKLIVTTAFGVGIGLVSTLLNFVVARAILLVRDIGLPVSGEQQAAAIGQIVLCGLFTLAGFGIGAIIRQPAGAIPLLLIWPLIVENIAAGLLSNFVSERAPRWLPFASGFRLSIVGDADPLMSRLPAGLYFAAFVAVFVGVGWLLVERRDA